MKRLRDYEGPSPLLAKAQALLDSEDPVPESEERMWRIRRELDRPRSGFSPMRRFPALVLAACLLLFGASALAAVRLYEAVRAQRAHGEAREGAREARDEVARGRGVRAGRAASRSRAAIAREPSAQQLAARGSAPERSMDARGDVQSAAVEPAKALPDALDARPTRREAAHGAAAAGRGPRRALAKSGAATPPASAPSARDDEPQRGAHARAAGHSAHEASDAQAAAVAQPHSEKAESASELVHQALRALRRERDPARAARLLAQYRKLEVAGPLAEEALSLQIEAATILRDARARAWAREYLARYPNGRYRALAQRAAQMSAP